jgi:hypothetical protein
MIRHVVLFRFQPGTDGAAVAAMAAALDRLPSSIPEIVTYRHGPDIGAIDTDWDHVLVAEFRSIRDYRVYETHPDHRAVIDRYISPILADVARIQYDIGEGAGSPET